MDTKMEEIKDIILKIVDDGEWGYVYLGGVRSRKLEAFYNDDKINSEDIRRLLEILVGNIRIVAFKDPESDSSVTLFIAEEDIPASKAD